MKIALHTILVLSLFSIVVLGQNVTQIKGNVTDEQGTPLTGAEIFIRSLSLGTVANDSGNYNLSVPKKFSKNQKVTLTVKYLGYKSQRLKVTLDGSIILKNFTLKEDVFKSGEVVVTGLASKTSKSRAEVSVSRVNAAELTNTSSFQTLPQLVEGQISGVQVTSPSGNSGAGFRFYVRGGGGLNGDEQPVIYVDGIRMDNDEFQGWGVGGQGVSSLATLDPEDISKIEVLKGPAAAAMYGTSGSNGVVLISTKSGETVGRTHKLSVNYKYDYGLNTQSYKYKTSDYLSANDANAIFRNGVIRQNTLNISGGSGSLRYFGSFDDRFEQGITMNNELDRKSLRINLTTFTIPDLTLKVSAGYSFANVNRPPNDNTLLGLLGNTLLFPTSYLNFDSASIYNIKDISNLESFTGGVQVTYTPINKLEFYFNGGIDNSSLSNSLTFPIGLPIVPSSAGAKGIGSKETKQFTYDFNGRYSYDILKGLNATTILGAQLFDRTDKDIYLFAENFPNSFITSIGAGTTIDSYGEDLLNTREAGIFAEQDFSYYDQYFLTLGLRRDYASSIGSEAPSILYPKVSFALRVDKYNWFPSNILDLFKVRAAYGENGQLPKPLDPIQFLWQATQGGYGAGATIFNIGNPSIKPERIKEFETGFDAEFLRNYSIEFTYYRQNATNSIVYKQESPSTGLTDSNVPFNIGRMKNWGFETLLKANLIRSKEYGLNLSLIWNYQNNEVTSLGGASPIFEYFNVNVIKEGLPKHEFYTYKVLGAKFNPDGTYAGVNATNYKVDFGNSIPNHTGSFSISFKFLKNFNFYALADWALNRRMYNYTKLYASKGGNVPGYNTLKAKLGLTPDHPEITRLTPGSSQYIDAANRFARMDYTYPGNYIEAAAYLKIGELSLSYSLRDLLPEINFNDIKNIIVGISALNIWTLTNYSGPDVNLNVYGSRSLSRGVDFLSLEHPRVYNFWIRVAL